MILITSAEYVTSDFVSEIGLIPPSFLPIGNQRLYKYQIELFSSLDEEIYLSLPQNFEISKNDLEYLNSKQIHILYVPRGLNLGQSILYCWNATGKIYKDLRILHGDTYFKNLQVKDLNTITVDFNDGYYERAVVSKSQTKKNKIETKFSGEGELVLSGYFSFAQPQILFKGIIESNNSFISGLLYYDNIYSLNELTDNGWLDFGHLNIFFQSRSNMTTQRSFNKIKITSRFTKKSSINRNKIDAEANWFLQIPKQISWFVPKLIDFDQDNSAYTLEYLYLLPLNDLFIYGNLNRNAWRTILRAVDELIKEFLYVKLPKEYTLPNYNYLKKTLNRLDNLDLQFFDIQDQIKDFGLNLEELAKESSKYISNLSRENTILSHGDLCFSNILYDSRSQSIKVIDPRGMDFNNTTTIYGDKRYDLSKLYHSVIGLYDFIIADRYQIEYTKDNLVGDIKFELTNEQRAIQNIFVEMFLKDEDLELEILAITIHLFISMLPLHSDKPKRQKAMLANIKRLFQLLKTKV